MSRNQLHITKLNDFKTWLEGQKIECRDGRGEYQVLQVRIPKSKEWAAVYSRIEMPEHYTVDRRLERLVATFCANRRQA